MTERQIQVTDSDFQRLKTLLRDNWRDRREDVGDLNRLEYEIERARIVRSTEVPKDVVTMNSRVRVRDLIQETPSCSHSFTLPFLLRPAQTTFRI